MMRGGTAEWMTALKPLTQSAAHSTPSLPPLPDLLTTCEEDPEFASACIHAFVSLLTQWVRPTPILRKTFTYLCND